MVLHLTGSQIPLESGAHLAPSIKCERAAKVLRWRCKASSKGERNGRNPRPDQQYPTISDSNCQMFPRDEKFMSALRRFSLPQIRPASL
jgi:hypothetical protein